MGRSRALAAVVTLGLLLAPAGPARAQLNCNVGVEFYPGGAIRSCTLNGHHRIHTARGEPLTCASGHAAVLYEDGRLKGCVLARPLTWGPLSCAAGQRLDLGPDGEPTGCRAAPAPGR
ncbi:MAG: hypothetical protein ACREKQ_15515 [Candidatus Rokuibacteriota bacterium]